MRCRQSPSQRCAVIAFFLALVTGCGHQPSRVTSMPPRSPSPAYHGKVESVEYYERMLLDKTFRWDGPCSREDRIPVLHAARALAYIGDPAVPALLRASKNKSINFVSVKDALAEIGLPVHQFWKDGNRADPTPLEKW
jgi:hypothetical protein